MKKMLKSGIFWSVSIAIAVVVLISGYNLNRAYQSETDVLIIPRNETSADSISQIIENGRQIATSLSFYNNLIKDHAEINDGAQGLSAYERKVFWNSKINISPAEKSGILKITVKDKDKKTAEGLSQISAQELAASMSQFYNIKTDIDIRFIDGPITRTAVGVNMFILIFISALAGLIIGFLNFILTEFASRLTLKPKKIDLSDKFQIKARMPLEYDFAIKKDSGVNIPKKPQSATAAGTSRKSFAPENLPIAQMQTAEKSESAPVIKEATAEEVAAKISELKKPAGSSIIKEATPEEVKERLNRLLSGKF